MHAWGNQLVPELLLKPSYTLQAQCTHIELYFAEWNGTTLGVYNGVEK